MKNADHIDLIWAEGDDKNLSSQPRLHQHGIEGRLAGKVRATTARNGTGTRCPLGAPRSRVHLAVSTRFRWRPEPRLKEHL